MEVFSGKQITLGMEKKGVKEMGGEGGSFLN